MRFERLCCAIIGLLTFFSACKKDSNTVSLDPNFYIVNGGVADSAQTLILFSSSDTMVYNVVISSTYYLSSKALVTVGVSDEARVSYNSRFNKDYQPMPAGAYSFKDTITATTSSVYDTIPVSIYRHALSPDKEYMLPIKILDASGHKIDTASSIIYLHTVSSPFAGIYNSSGTKTLYNGDAADSSVNSIDTFTLTKSLMPIDSNLSQLDYADLGSNGWKYKLSFSSDIPGNPPEFTIGANDVILSSVQSSSFKILNSVYNSTTKAIYIKSSYKNTSGNERIIEETLTLK